MDPKKQVLKSDKEITLYGPTAREFMMLTARRYEVHNFKVKKYFENRPNNLLILDLANDKNAFEKLKHFLECPISDSSKGDGNEKGEEFPRDNVAPDGMKKEMIPKNYSLDWRNFNFSKRFADIYAKSEGLDTALYEFVHGATAS